jgi:hypothetical protein
VAGLLKPSGPPVEPTEYSRQRADLIPLPVDHCYQCGAAHPESDYHLAAEPWVLEDAATHAAWPVRDTLPWALDRWTLTDAATARGQAEVLRAAAAQLDDLAAVAERMRSH